TGATREVEHERSRADAERGDRVLAPAAVEAEGDDAVHAVVRRRDAVEHALDRAVLLVAFGKWLLPPQCNHAHVRSQPGSSRAAASAVSSPTASRCSCATSRSTLRK